MSTIENLKLRNIEVLDSMTLRAATSSSSSSGDVIDGGSLPEVVVYGSAGSKSSSGSGTEGAMGSYFASWYYGSASGSGSGSEFNYASESGLGYSYPIGRDCRTNSDCGKFLVCDAKKNARPWESNVCRELSVTEKACVGLSQFAACAYEWNNKIYRGECAPPMGAPIMYCSDKAGMYKSV